MIGAYTDFLAGLPVWASYLVRGIAVCALLCCSAVVLSRAGRNPYWALLMIVPYFYVPVILICAFAFARWPRIDRG
jgi:hypothetical protein